MLPAKLKSPLALTSIVVGLLLVVGVAYVAWAYLTTHNTTKLKMVPQATVKQSLKTANDANIKNFEVRTDTVKALNEKQFVLVTADEKVNPTTLKAETDKEISRRLAEIKANQKLIESVTPDAEAVKKKVAPSLNTTQKTLEALQKALSDAGTDADKLKTVALYTDAEFAQYTTVNQTAKLLANQQTQVKYAEKLKGTIDTLQQSFDAAKSNGATHINVGPAGFVSLKSMQTNIDKLRQNLNANLAVSKTILTTMSSSLGDKPLTVTSTPNKVKLAVASGSTNANVSIAGPSGQSDITLAATLCFFGCVNISLPPPPPALQQFANGITAIAQGLSSAGTALLNGNLAGVQSGLSDAGAGVLQVAQPILGAVGVNTCLSGQDCSGKTNVGFVNICMNGANCTDQTNVSLVGNFCVGANCSNSTNVGTVNGNLGGNTSNSTNVGAVNSNIGGNSSGSTNNGVVNSNIGGNSSNSTNNGAVNSNIGGNSSGSTNNGVVNSNIGGNSSGSTNNGVVNSTINGNGSSSINIGVFVDCSAGSNCSGSKNTGVAVTCSTGSDCTKSTNNAGIVACGLGANCSGSTNNGVFVVCGAFALCTDSTNSGFLNLCIGIADCSNSTVTSFINMCSAITKCTSTSTIKVVKLIDC